MLNFRMLMVILFLFFHGLSRCSIKNLVPELRNMQHIIVQVRSTSSLNLEFLNALNGFAGDSKYRSNWKSQFYKLKFHPLE